MERAILLIIATHVLGALTAGSAAQPQADGFHVYPGQSIQEAVELAAAHPTHKVVKVHAGTYRPARSGQALVWFNRKHDGIRLEALGEVILTAENRDLADRAAASFPALVNHVVYFGDGISSNTVLRGFTITGANDFFSTNNTAEIEPNESLVKGLFFYGDGGGIKVFGRSYPVIEEVTLEGNYANPCAGGFSVEHDGHQAPTSPQPVTIRNCVLRNNRALVNGAALDVLIGSFAVVSNCLFVGNAGNFGFNYVTDPLRPPEFTNTAVLCVFPNARIIAQNCTFTGNRNGVHDQSTGSVYENCIFADNTLAGGFYTSRRYEFHLEKEARLGGCVFRGSVIDPQRSISPQRNTLEAPPPEFDERFVPRHPLYATAGHRPTRSLRPLTAHPATAVPPMTDRDREKYQRGRTSEP